jgi:PHS family inorganic phosphate transporter-like MFS transporter
MIRGLVAALLLNANFRTFITGSGFFADSYDLFITEGVTAILKNLGPIVRMNYTMPDGSGHVISYFTAACSDDTKCMPRIYNTTTATWVPQVGSTFREEMIPRYQQQTSALKSAVNTAALVGSVVGQLVFGFAGDIMGRKLNWVVAAALIIFGALGSSSSALGFRVEPKVLNAAGNWGVEALGTQPSSFSRDVYGQLVIWRALLGLGVGAEYPLSATIASEGADSVRSRGASVLWTFSMQGWGKLTASLLNYALISSTFAYGGTWSIDGTWRFALGFGCALSVLTIGFRAYMEESHIYTEARRKHVDALITEGKSSPAPLTERAPLRPQVIVSAVTSSAASVAQRTKFGLLATFNVLKNCRWALLGTASTWFLIDVTFYGQSLMSSTVLADVFGSNAGVKALDKLRSSLLATVWTMLIALPGYWVAIAAVERTGRKPLQLWGFVACAAAFAVLGAFYNTPLRTGGGGAGFLVFYGLTYFTTNAGPNSMTFLIPTEAFPTLARSSAHGISAASGKIGATLGSIWLLDLFYSFCVSQRDSTGAPNCSAAANPSDQQRSEINRGIISVMVACAATALFGAVMTHFFVPETGKMTLQDVDERVGKPGSEAKRIDASDDATNDAPLVLGASGAVVWANSKAEDTALGAAPHARSGEYSPWPEEGKA